MLLDFFKVGIVICLASVLTLVSPVTILREYKARSTVYGEPLDTITTPNLLQCARACSRDVKCRSAIFESTGTCTPDTWVANDSIVCDTQSECSVQNAPTYMEKEPKTTMRMSCLNDDECVDLRSVCVLGQCQCEPGYHFDGNNHACVTSCSSYGSTFTFDIDYRINGNNIEYSMDISLKTCKEICLATSGYVCVTFDYGYLQGKTRPSCRLQNVTASDVPTELRSYVGINLYKRDCVVH